MSEKSKIKASIVFVCTGNTCRSPMAEYLFKDFLRQKKRSGDFTVTSAGLEAAKGDTMMPQADEALQILGVKHEAARKSKVFTVQMSLDSDLIIGMTDEHAMRCDSENALSFRDIIGTPIADPYGMSTEVYLRCAEMMRSAFDRILEIADERLAEKRSD